MKNIRYIFLTILIIAGLSQCTFNKGNDDTDPEPEPGTMEALNIPDGFNFETTKKITVDLNSLGKKTGSSIKHTLYLWDESFSETKEIYNQYSDETINIEVKNYTKHKLGSYYSDGTNTIEIEVPSYIDNMYIISDDPSGETSTKLLDLTTSGKKDLSSTSDILAASNAIIYLELGHYFFSLDLNGDVIEEAYTPSSINNKSVNFASHAIDSENGIIYHDGFNIGSIIYYTIGKTDYKELGSHGQSGMYGLAYNKVDKHLYGVDLNANKLYKFSTEDGLVKDEWNLSYNGSPLSGKINLDLAFDDAGVLYLAVEKQIFKAVELESLPTLELSLEKDFTGEISNYIGGIDFLDNLIYIGDISAKLYSYNPSDKSLTFINDLPYATGDIAIYDKSISLLEDSDNDGVPNANDEYPDDAERATNIYYPSKDGYNITAYEDLWPSKGDYDFNDLVVKSSLKRVLNANGNMVEDISYITVLHWGGSFKNGFAVAYSNLAPDKITNFDRGDIQLTHGIINETNGVENNQSNAVMVFFDDQFSIEKNKEYIFTTTFATGTPRKGSRGFMIKNGNRDYEIHNAYSPPTDLADVSIFGTYDDDSNPSTQRYYVNKFGLPWSLNLSSATEFNVPVEGTTILEAYPNFKSWVESGGTQDQDWYLYPEAAFVE